MYFPETGHNLRGSFLNQWQMLGGETAVGLPISEEGFRDGVGIVQSFEGITLLLDPSKSPPGDVAGVLLPESSSSMRLRPSQPGSVSTRARTMRFFVSTFPKPGTV